MQIKTELDDGDSVPSLTTFSHGRTSTENEARVGCPYEMVEKSTLLY